jgi:ABC-type multidrug transport system fused ATPase/permease subunit
MLKNILLKYKKITALYLTNGWIQIAASMLAIVYFQRLIDGIGAKDYAISVRMLAIYGALELINYILCYVDNYPESVLKNGLYYRLKAEAIRKISSIDYLSYKKYGTGEVIQLVENGADAGRNILAQFYLRIARELLPNIIISMTLIALYDYKVLLAVIISYSLVFLITKLLLKKLYLVKNTTLINEEKLSSKFVRALMEMVVFRLNGRYKKEILEYSKRSDETVKSKTKILMTHEMFFTAFAVIVAVIKIVAIFIGIRQVIAGVSSVGIIVALVSLIDRVYEPIAIFNVEYVDYKLNKVAFARYEKLMAEPDDTSLANGFDAKIDTGRISFDDVVFSYGGIKVLDGFNASLQSGKTYALVGKSGAGKTTVLNLLSGLIKTQSGKVTIDGQDLSEIELSSYYKNIAYLSQSPAVFDGTVRENLAFDASVSDEILWDALKKVNLAERITAMPAGLDSGIGEKGGMLSGGEKQRLALARVIVTQPKIVILDEPTSALDTINERAVMRNVFGALQSSSVIAVTHRVHTTHVFDEVILIDNARAQAIDTADSLLKSNALFKRLHQSEKNSVAEL